MSDAKKELLALEEAGKYVFHGSGMLVGNFQPQQAYNDSLPDGESAIFASPRLEYAIFMALLNKENCPAGYHARVDNLNSGNLIYRATQESIDQLNDQIKGYVYVFHKKDFVMKNTSEWVSNKSVSMYKMFTVSKQDFDQPIRILE